MKKINCYRCIYFYTTWDEKKPRGCKYFGFKSKVMPSVIVFKSSNNECKAFKEKKS